MEVIEEKKINAVDQDEIEIRLGDIIQFLKYNRLKILIGAIIGLIIGMIYVIPKPNLYTVEVTIMPEIQGRGINGLGNLGGGYNFGLGMDNANAADAIRPDLYPNVITSIPFAMNMLNQKVYSKKLGAAMTLQEFITRTNTSSFIDKIRGLFAGNDDDSNEIIGKQTKQNTTQAIQVTKGQYGLIKAVQSSVSSSFDKKTGIITVTAVETDPVVAATVAELSLKYLTDYIIAYRTDKARRRVYFLTRQVQEAKHRYQNAEYALSNYRDQNRSLYLNTAKLDEQRLQANYILEQSVYNDLARQLEQAKIKVEDDTPTFKTIEPAVVPLQKSGPKRTLIILVFGVLSAFLTLSILFIRSRNLFV